jgi:hypothetical protein
MGTEAFWIPAALAAVSAGGQYVNTQNANKRQQNAEVQAMDNQKQFSDAAKGQVNKQIQNIATSNPAAAAMKEQGDFVSTLRKNVGGKGTSNAPTNFGAPTSALGPTPGADSRFGKDSATASNQTQSYGDTNAGEMSAVDTAVRQRQNEGLQMQTLGANLNTLGAESYTKNFADQLRAQAAGQANPWVSLFSNMTGGAAGAMAKNGWFAKPAGAAGTVSAVPNMTNPSLYG